MKKRIIAAVVALIMTVLSLASCGAAFNFAEDDLYGYVAFDAEGFWAALNALEIEDEDFTTNEETRKTKVVKNLYSTLTSNMISAAGDDEKIKTGVPSVNDVIYFCYYCVDADGNVFYTSQMKDSTVTASATKDAHTIKLADYKEDNELQAALAQAITAAIGEGKAISEYKINTTKGAAINTKTEGEGENAKVPATVVISYKLTYELPAVDEEGNPVLDEDGNPTKDTYTYVVNYRELDLGSDDPLAVALRSENVTFTVGNNAYVTEGEGESATKNYTIKTTEQIDENNTAVVCSYTEVCVQWIVEEKPAAYVTVNHTPYSSSNKVEPDGNHTSGDKIDLDDKELTYYVYPVYYIAVPELDATSIMKDILGKKNFKTTTIDVFTSEEYKAGDKTAKTMVETIVNVWAEDDDALKAVKIDDTTTLLDLHNAYHDASDAVTAAGDKATDEQKAAKTAAQEKYEDALDKAIDDKIAELLTATKAEADPIADVIVKEYKDVVYDNLKNDYDNKIVEKVGKAVWDLVQKYAEIKAYPEKLVAEFVDHLYEGYENDFYTGDYTSSSTSGSSSTSTVSNYTQYNGDFDAYLKAKLGEDVDAGLKKEAEEAIKPILIIYAAARALEDAAVAALPGYVDLDIAAGVYDADFEWDDSVSDRKNEKNKEKAEKQAEENKIEAKEDAEKFVITDKVFKEYKKEIGNSVYKVYEEQYGVINMRAALQSNRLFYYLLATDVEKNDDGEFELKYKTVGEGENATEVISFRTFTYTIKAEEAK